MSSGTECFKYSTRFREIHNESHNNFSFALKMEISQSLKECETDCDRVNMNSKTTIIRNLLYIHRSRSNSHRVQECKKRW